jgi:hypothetical protein
MPPISLVPVSDRYLSFAECEEIAVFHAQHVGVREIARRLAFTVDDQPGPQRINTQQRTGVSGNDGAMARRTAGQSPEDFQARRQRPPA